MKYSLQELQAKMLFYYSKWVFSGGQLTTYFCNHCKQDILTKKPKKANDCDSRGFWDSATQCILCGGTNFVKTYPNGNTQSIALEN